MKIEFFHDVICSFCFPMSYRMRQLAKIHPNVQIIHRSFALVREEADFSRMFGSRKAAKGEILAHWEHANQNDGLHRFNIKGMQEQDFLFPRSIPALRACKAAYFVGGDAAYWDVFDALQNALFVQNKNVEVDDVIEACVQTSSIDLAKWCSYLNSAEVEKALEDDFNLVQHYGIRGVPCLVIDEKRVLNGAQPLNVILDAVKSVSNETADDAVCRLEDDGSVNCG